MNDSNTMLVERREFLRQTSILGMTGFLSNWSSHTIAEGAADHETTPESRRPIQNEQVLYGQTALPVGIRSRLINNNNGCTMHVLEQASKPEAGLALCCSTAFPSWRSAGGSKCCRLRKPGFTS